MFRIGTVKGFEVAPNRDGNSDRLLLQVEMSNSDDIQTVELRNPPGDDSNPINGSQVTIFDGGQAFKLALGIDDGVTPDMNPGERKIYAIDSDGAIVAFMKLLASGAIEINSTDDIKLLASGIIELHGDTDFAVRFSELKTGFDLLKANLNTFISVYNSHNHPTAPVGPVSTPSATGTSSTASIDSSKIDEIKVP